MATYQICTSDPYVAQVLVGVATLLEAEPERRDEVVMGIFGDALAVLLGEATLPAMMIKWEEYGAMSGFDATEVNAIRESAGKLHSWLRDDDDARRRN